jgi:hypothetical protein
MSYKFFVDQHRANHEPEIALAVHTPSGLVRFWSTDTY